MRRTLITLLALAVALPAFADNSRFDGGTGGYGNSTTTTTIYRSGGYRGGSRGNTGTGGNSRFDGNTGTGGNSRFDGNTTNSRPTLRNYNNGWPTYRPPQPSQGYTPNQGQGHGQGWHHRWQQRSDNGHNGAQLAVIDLAAFAGGTLLGNALAQPQQTAENPAENNDVAADQPLDCQWQQLFNQRVSTDRVHYKVYPQGMFCIPDNFAARPALALYQTADHRNLEVLMN